MRHRRLILWLSWFFIAIFFLSGAFGSLRNIEGKYYLNVLDLEPYYIQQGLWDMDTPYGFANGIVLSIGWNDEHIVIKRYSENNKIDWVIIDIDRDILRGPFSDDQIKGMKEFNVDFMPPGEAWDRLGKVQRFFGWLVGIGFIVVVSMWLYKVINIGKSLQENIRAKINEARSKVVLAWTALVAVWLFFICIGW